MAFQAFTLNLPLKDSMKLLSVGLPGGRPARDPSGQARCRDRGRRTLIPVDPIAEAFADAPPGLDN
jgi:hypothetical protein